MRSLALKELQQQAHYVQVSKQLFEAKYTESERQLASLVQTQVSETQRALELLKSVWIRLEKTIEEMDKIEEWCADCKELLGKEFKAVLYISRAQKNLTMTGAVQQLFAEIPHKAKQITQLLLNNPDEPSTMITVYERTVELVELKEKAIARGDSYMQALGTSTEKHFESLNNLRIELEKQVRLNVSDALFLGVEIPALMVATMVVCVREDKRNAMGLKRVLTGTKEEWKLWREEANASIKEEIHQTQDGGLAELMEDEFGDVDADGYADEMDEQAAADAYFSGMSGGDMLVRNDTIMKLTGTDATMKEKILTELEEWITEQILRKTGTLSSDETVAVVSDPDTAAVSDSTGLDQKGGNNITDFTKAIDSFMKDLDLIVKQVHLCFPADYDILNFLVDCYLRALMAPIFTRLNASEVKTQDRLSVVKWMNSFLERVEQLSRSITQLMISLDTDESSSLTMTTSSTATIKRDAIAKIIQHVTFQKGELLDSYINHCEQRVKGWMENIIMNEKKNNYESNFVRDIPRTHCPQDLLTSLNPQFETTMKNLCGQDCVAGLEMILSCVLYFKDLLASQIVGLFLHGSSSESSGGGADPLFEEDYLCALINTCHDIGSRIKDKIDDILLDYNDYHLTYEQMEHLDASYDEMTRQFTQLASKCINNLCLLIYHSVLKENVFDKLFKSEWMNDEDNNMIRSLCITLDEYQKDFQLWIEEHQFYKRFVQRMCQFIVNAYAKALCDSKIKIAKQELLDRMKGDHDILHDFYLSSDNHHDQNDTGVIDFCKQQLRQLDTLRMCLDPETYEMFGDTFQTDLQKLDCSAELLKLVAKIKPCTSSGRGSVADYDDKQSRKGTASGMASSLSGASALAKGKIGSLFSKKDSSAQ